MPLAVCDYEPCAPMQSALQKLVVVPEGEEDLNIVVLGRNQPLKTYYFPLTYCPFCGTRIEDEWVEAFISAIQGRRSTA